ncbi:uncharacterized protein LOC119613221 [Lucilia sericata]|uniref:uncharacterized protein LOC119613221 n=1 Tax=Lucilia sericata TaxID=13632 RepID=UPI0018A81C0F|nr:uncharacterized protein LOC119613221 [Lucilia sericata]
MPVKIASPINTKALTTTLTATASTATTTTKELPLPSNINVKTTSRSPPLTLSSKSQSADNTQRVKVKYLQTHNEYPMSTLSPRQFTLKRQKRIGEQRPLTRKATPRASSMRKSRSLDAEHSYSLSSIQAPLWVTLTNARTIEELSREQI